MSQRLSRIAWGTVLGILGFVCVGLTLGQAPKAKRPAVETLLPAGAIVYVGVAGQDAQKVAWEKTAAYDALYKTGLMAVIEKAMNSFGAADDQGEEMKALQKGLTLVQAKGYSLVISLPPADFQGPPIPSIVAVLHDAAVLEAGLNKLLKESDEIDLEITEKEVQGRKVSSVMVPELQLPVEVSWWSEGPHLVIAAGMSMPDASVADSIIAVAAGKAPNITTDANWKKYNAGNADFDVAFVGWFDFGTLRQRFGGIPIPLPGFGGGEVQDTQPADNEADADDGAAEAADAAVAQAGPKMITANQVLKALGLDTMGTIVCRTGYKGRALWSETKVEAPSPRRGLLAYWDQKPITLDDLPPLPFGQNGFYACSIDWSKFYDTTTTIVSGLAKLGPEEAAVQVEGALQNLPAIIGFDPKKDLFDPLGNVFCCYSDTRQSILGLGSALVIKVDDAATLRKTLTDLTGMAAEQFAPNELNVSTTKKQGRDIVTLEIAEGVFNPSYVVDDGWLAIGLFPQTVEAFLLRVDGKLTNWTPTLSYQRSLAEMPKEFTSISASDPRKSVRFLMGLAPIILPALQAGLKQFPIPGLQDVELDISAADLPPAELVARPLFPNVSTCTADKDGLTWTSRSSLPSIPLVGGVGGVATIGVAAALLLPAVTQARTAARRTSSKNNLKQIALALHNYHDTHQSFPQGTNPNDDLKPEKRLSWQASILPFLDQAALYNSIDFDEAWDSDANKRFLRAKIPSYQNPGVEVEKEPDYGSTHYVGIAGIGKDAATLPMKDKNVGVFGYNRKTRIRDITDGTSNTMMVSEAAKKYGSWGAGGTGSIRGFVKKPYINGPDNIGGPYPGGCNVSLCDGSVRFISEKIDPSVLENLARIHDGNVIGEF